MLSTLTYVPLFLDRLRSIRFRDWLIVSCLQEGGKDIMVLRKVKDI